MQNSTEKSVNNASKPAVIMFRISGVESLPGLPEKDYTKHKGRSNDDVETTSQILFSKEQRVSPGAGCIQSLRDFGYIFTGGCYVQYPRRKSKPVNFLFFSTTGKELKMSEAAQKALECTTYSESTAYRNTRTQDGENSVLDSINLLSPIEVIQKPKRFLGFTQGLTEYTFTDDPNFVRPRQKPKKVKAPEDARPV